MFICKVCHRGKVACIYPRTYRSIPLSILLSDQNFSFMQYLAASRGVWTCSELNLGSPKYIFTRRKYCRVLTSYRSIFVFLVQWICLWTINCGFCKTSDGLKFGMQSFTIGGASGPVFRSCWASYLRCSSIGFITSQSIGRR